MKAVTCFSDAVYEKTGKKMLQSFVKNWPCKIVAYYEDTKPDFEHEKIEYKPLYDIFGMRNFLNHLVRIPRANGVVLQDGKERYNYNYDIWKFCRKLFAQYDVLEKEKGKVFWLDADVITKKPIPEQFLNDLFFDPSRNKESHLVFLGREGFHSETGFVGFDTLHPAFPTFFFHYVKCIQQGIVFQLERWHDCAVFDWARMDEGANLSPFWKEGDELSVWEKTVLSDYMDHYKGNTKNLVENIEIP